MLITSLSRALGSSHVSVLLRFEVAAADAARDRPGGEHRRGDPDPAAAVTHARRRAAGFATRGGSLGQPVELQCRTPQGERARIPVLGWFGKGGGCQPMPGSLVTVMPSSSARALNRALW